MKNKKQVKIAVFMIVIFLAMGGLGGFFYYRSAAYAYRNFIRELHRLDTEKIVHWIEIQDGPWPSIHIDVYLKNHMFPKSKKIPMKNLAELTERYREACDRLLTEENPDCRGPYGNLCLYFHPSAYMTGQSYVIFELERKIEWDTPEFITFWKKNQTKTFAITDFRLIFRENYFVVHQSLA